MPPTRCSSLDRWLLFDCSKKVYNKSFGWPYPEISYWCISHRSYLLNIGVSAAEAGEQVRNVPRLVRAGAERVVGVAAPHVHVARLAARQLAHVVLVQHRVLQGLVVVLIHDIRVYTYESITMWIIGGFMASFGDRGVESFFCSTIRIAVQHGKWSSWKHYAVNSENM